MYKRFGVRRWVRCCKRVSKVNVMRIQELSNMAHTYMLV